MPNNYIDSIRLSGTTYQIQGDVTVDTSLDSGSTNPVENKAIYNKFDEVEQVTAAALNELNDAVSGKQDKLVAGRGITITTGETANTVSFGLPIYSGSGTNAIVMNHIGNTASGTNSHAEGNSTKANGNYSHAEGVSATASGNFSHAEGVNTTASGTSSHAEGRYTIANGFNSHTEGYFSIANNESEHASGQYNNSVSASTTFGDSGNTLFSVGNGTSTSARHNAFEIRQNGDIYLTLDGQDVKLQDQLGGSSITVDTSLDPTSTNPVENKAIYNKFDEVEQVTAAGLNALNDSKVNVADNNASAYTFENKIGSAEFGYSEHFAGPIYIRYTGSTSSSGGYYAGGITYYTSEWGWENISLSFDLSDGQITATTVSSAYFDIEIENGEATLTFKDGYYLRQCDSQNGFIALTKTAYESGQSADVIEDTVYDVFDKLNDKIDKAGDNAVTGCNISFIDGYIVSSLFTKNTSLSSSVKIDSSTIKSGNDGLSVQFATPEAVDKILNVGSGSYGTLFSTGSYNTSFNEFTITFNPNCTHYNVYNFSVRIIDASNAMYDVSFDYDSADMSAEYTDLSTYCTVTDTLSTDYKLKVTAKEGYKIARLHNNEYMVGGVDNTNPNMYISNLVTTPSYVHDGQDVIDDIYDKLDDKQDTLVSGTNIKTINNESILGSGNIVIGGGGTVDTSLDPTSTNPVQNRAIYNKIDEVEQVTAAGLNAVNDKFDGLRLKKLTQTEYNNLQTKDPSTLYVIVD